jgi:hypothetical protein
LINYLLGQFPQSIWKSFRRGFAHEPRWRSKYPIARMHILLPVKYLILSKNVLPWRDLFNPSIFWLPVPVLACRSAVQASVPIRADVLLGGPATTRAQFQKFSGFKNMSRYWANL